VQGKCEDDVYFVDLVGGAAHLLAITGNQFSSNSLFNNNKASGKVYSWGKCHYGQLGMGFGDVDFHLPIEIKSLSNIKSIGAGDSFSMAITNDGDLYTWGCG
jgi:alpha-tubulin suppressor-like RCC1 family protein